MSRLIFYDHPDTIKIDEKYSFKVRFGVPLKGDCKIYVGSDWSNNQLLDTLQVLTASNGYKCEVSPKNLGANFVCLKVDHDDSLDTLTANVTLKHQYFVIE